MDWRTLNAIISGASLVIMFVWGWLDTFQHSWLAVFVGGIAVGIISSANKRKEKENTEKKNQDPWDDSL